jgi:hypothetical protein
MPVLQEPIHYDKYGGGEAGWVREVWAWMRSDSTGKPVGRLAKPDLLRSMDMVMTEINVFLIKTG